MESRKIVIDPVTRIEGHAKVILSVGENGKIEEGRISITQFRGFEKFCEGRPYSEMPSLTARTCGICPVSHLIASSKACDVLMAVTIPPAAVLLRRVIHLAQLVQSHALNFFHLSSADLVYGMDAPAAGRNIFHLMQTHPAFAKDGIRLRAIGQGIIERLGGKRIHPGWIVPGGVSHHLEPDVKTEILAVIPEALEIALRTLEWFKEAQRQFTGEIEHFGTAPTLFMALVGSDGGLEHYDGRLRIIDADGEIVEDAVDPAAYLSILAEAVEKDSYLKSPYYKPYGKEKGVYRVGPLARLNIATHCGTPAADAELEAFKALGGGRPVQSSFYYHYARLIEIVYGIERIGQLLNDPEILDENVRAHAGINKRHGVGCAEAPRGTLFHDYRVDADGIITDVNMLIATGNNNLPMNQSVKEVAQAFVDGTNPTDGQLNRVEAVIRAYDPCFSCSTHALGSYGMAYEFVDRDGRVLQKVFR